MRQIFEDIISQKTESVINDASNKNLKYDQSFSVQIPAPEEKIVLNKSSIKKILKECSEAKKSKNYYADMFLGISTLLLGGFFSAIISQMEYKIGFLNVMFYTICPTIGGVFGVAYFFERKKENYDINKLSSRIEEELSNLNTMESEVKSNEY